jgi:hypothetical protein
VLGNTIGKLIINDKKFTVRIIPKKIRDGRITRAAKILDTSDLDSNLGV